MTTLEQKTAEAVKERSKPFPLEKILTVSARDYCESVGKSLGDYVMRGIVNSYSDEFPKKVPEDAEVVVDYRLSSFERHVKYACGTALIPKPKEAALPTPITPSRLVGRDP